MMLSNTEIGEKLKYARKQLSLSQRDIAAVLGVTFQQVQKYEKGTNRLSAESIQYLYKKLGINVLGEMTTQGASLIDERGLDGPEMELLKSFRKIKNPDIQRKVLHLIKAIHSDQ